MVDATSNSILELRDATPVEIAIAAVGMAVQWDIAASTIQKQLPYNVAHHASHSVLADMAVEYARVIQDVAKRIEAK